MRNGGMLGVPNTDGRGSWSPLELGLGLNSGGGAFLATRNILNGVLNCAWDKTSAAPKLLEVYENSFVKFNIDGDNPLVLAFANGWDDKDRPAQVIKSLAVAPANIDLSAKANCHVQIVAKVINDEVVITTHDSFNPGWEVQTPVIPTNDFASGYTNAVPYDATTGFASTKNGWMVSTDAPLYSSKYPRYVFVNAQYWRYSEGVGSRSLTVMNINGMAIPFYRIRTVMYNSNTEKLGEVWVYRKYPGPEGWYRIEDVYRIAGDALDFARDFYNTTRTDWLISGYRLKQVSTHSTYLHEFDLYEAPGYRFVKSTNRVKNHEGEDDYGIPLGHVVLDGSGNITSLVHYYNYPGGMRVEA